MTGLLSGACQGLAFVGAVALAGLAGHAGASPLAFALIATLGLVATAGTLSIPLPHEVPALSVAGVAALIGGFLSAFTGLTFLDGIGLAREALVCPPQVPWRLTIAAFGAFALGWMSTALVNRGARYRMPLMVMLTLFWIAPFYGFFHAPWWLAMALAAPCEVRATQDVLSAAGLMVAGTVAGQWTAHWMFGAPKPR